MQHLSVINCKPQIEKSSNTNANVSCIKYCSLNELHLYSSHDDYLEEFLLHTKTDLKNDIHLFVNYESLQRVTHNFTRDATRFNCNKISQLHLGERNKPSGSYEEYFCHFVL